MFSTPGGASRFLATVTLAGQDTAAAFLPVLQSDGPSNEVTPGEHRCVFEESLWEVIIWQGEICGGREEARQPCVPVAARTWTELRSREEAGPQAAISTQVPGRPRSCHPLGLLFRSPELQGGHCRPDAQQCQGPSGGGEEHTAFWGQQGPRRQRWVGVIEKHSCLEVRTLLGQIQGLRKGRKEIYIQLQQAEGTPSTIMRNTEVYLTPSQEHFTPVLTQDRSWSWIVRLFRDK